MKVYWFLLLAVFVTVSQQELVGSNHNILQTLAEWKKIVEPFNTECMCKTGVTQDLLDNIWESREIPDDPCFKCAIKCWFQNLQFMNSKGVIDLDKYEKLIFGVDTAIAQKCGTIPGVDVCQKSYDVFMCVYRILVGQDPHPSRPNAFDPVTYLFKTKK